MTLKTVATFSAITLALTISGTAVATDLGSMASGAATDSAIPSLTSQGVDKAVDTGAGMAKDEIGKRAQGAAADAAGDAAAKGAEGGALSAAQAQAANAAVDKGAGMAKEAAKSGLK